MTNRCVRRYACPECGKAYDFQRLKGTRIRPHSVKMTPWEGIRVQCPGSGMLPVRAKGVAP